MNYYVHPILRIPVWFLILNNIVPIYGLLFLDWKVFDMAFYLIMETFIYAFFTIIKIIFIKNENIKPVKQYYTNKKTTHIGFFSKPQTEITKYEILITNPNKIKLNTISLLLLIVICFLSLLTFALFDTFKINFNSRFLLLGLIPFMSHLVSFIKNYILNEEFLKKQPDFYLHNFMNRFAALVFVVCFGIGFGKSVLLILTLFVRTIFDYSKHVKEHQVL